MKDGIYVIESCDESFGNYYAPTDVLYKKNSKFQEVFVFDTEVHGKILMHDNALMFNEKTEFYYHEGIVHSTMFLHKNPEKVLIIGGGDGGTLREVLKHKTLKEVTLVDIDGDVVKVCREFFPEMTKGFDDERTNLVIDDGAKYIKNIAENTFDVVIIDSNDPNIGKGVLSNPLISDEFYQDLRKILKDDGIGCQLSAHPYFYEESYWTVTEQIRKNWENLYPLFVSVPFFVSGSWGLCLFSKNVFNLKTPRECDISELKYYNHDVHRSLFAIPNYLMDKFPESL